MHRNTLFFILILFVLAALVATINIKHILNKETQTIPASTQQKSPSPAPLLTETPPPATFSATPIPTLPTKVVTKGKKQVAYDQCGVIFSIPDTLEIENTEGGILLSSSTSAAMPIVIACQKEIPRPSVTEDRIEAKTVDTIAGKLYHSQAAKDGTVTDALIFTHPKNQLDVLFGGSGEVFQTIIGSIKLIK